MTSSGGNLISDMILQQPVYMSDENSCSHGALNDIIPAFNNNSAEEQQVIYYTSAANIQPMNISQSYVYVQQLPNNQTANQSVPARIIAHHETQHQQLISSNNIATNIQSPVMHSNKNHQQAVLATCHPTINITEMPTSSMTNPTFASTPISTSIKRGRNDTSGISESYTQIRPQYPQITTMQTNRSSSENTPIKRLRSMNQPVTLTVDNSQQLTTAACRFATMQFPFSPFPVIFPQDV